MGLNDVGLVIGPVSFAGFEVPPNITFGGDQRLAVHDLPDGQRVIDAIGPTPQEIRWSGVFSGPNATLRARLLDALRSSGEVLPLSWDVFFYNVVVRSFEARYHNSAWVPYRISVTVLQDSAQQIAAAGDDLLGNSISDASAAAALSAQASIPLGSLQTALALPNATVPNTAASLAATTTLSACQSAVSDALASFESDMAGYISNGLSGGPALATMISTAGCVAALYNASGYLSRISHNLMNVNI